MKKIIFIVGLLVPAIVYATGNKTETPPVVEDEIPVHWTITDRITDLTIESPENDIINYIHKKFPHQKEMAVAVARAESGLNTMAHGDKGNPYAVKGSHGIFQINVAVHEELIGDRDVNYYKDNIDIAREIYDMSGWKAWGAYTDKRYLQFML